MDRKRQRRISSRACVSCRTKKVKCDCLLHHPCTNCVKYNTECVLASDKRTERPTSSYIKSLEQRADKAERMLQQILAANQSIVAQFGQQVAVAGLREESPEPDQEHLPEPLEPHERPAVHHRYTRPSAFQSKYDTEAISVYGPTSIFDNIPVQKSGADSHKHVEELDRLNKDTTVVECIKLFFNWLYPDIHMFIPREAFLVDFFDPKANNSSSSYCSQELVYALCSLGASISTDPALASKAQGFYERARASLLPNLEHPSITAFQSFILLGLYDIYNGRNNSGWVLSGMGLRMGFNLGFQLNPRSWYLKEQGGDIADLTVSVRSRIYWGAFVVDHLVGLLLGRPAILRINDTTIQESEATPDIDWIDEYNFPGYSKIIDISNPLKNVVQLIVITEDILHEVFYKPGSTSTVDTATLNGHVQRILDWRAQLPESLQWDTISLTERASDPTRMMLVYYYYIVLLCINRPFIKMANAPSRRLCETAISDLYVAISTFTSVHGYHQCSILIVYASIISVSVILLSTSGTGSTPAALDLPPEMRRNFFTFMNLLKRCAKTWKLSRRSFEMISKRLQTTYHLDYEAEYARFLKETEAVSANTTSSTASSLGTGTGAGGAGGEELLSDLNNYDQMFGGPPLFMNSEFPADWDSMFPDYGTSDS